MKFFATPTETSFLRAHSAGQLIRFRKNFKNSSQFQKELTSTFVNQLCFEPTGSHTCSATLEPAACWLRRRTLIVSFFRVAAIKKYRHLRLAARGLITGS